MIPLLHPVAFPISPNLRMEGGPRFNTTYLEDGAGNPQTVIGWDDPLWQWTIQFKKGSREFGQLEGFFMARKGSVHGWLFEDPFDCSDSDNGGTGLVRTQEDGKRYLVKRYPDVDDYAPYERIIKCPMPDTVQFSGVSGSPVVNRFTGEVTGATSDGYATFRFWNPVLFVSDVLDLKLQAGNAPGEWLNVELDEIRHFRLPE